MQIIKIEGKFTISYRVKFVIVKIIKRYGIFSSMMGPKKPVLINIYCYLVGLNKPTHLQSRKRPTHFHWILLSKPIKLAYHRLRSGAMLF